MDIRTTQEIEDEITGNNEFLKRKWFGLDDLIEKLNSICEHEAKDTYENDMEAMGLLCDFVEKLEKKNGF